MFICTLDTLIWFASWPLHYSWYPASGHENVQLKVSTTTLFWKPTDPSSAAISFRKRSEGHVGIRDCWQVVRLCNLFGDAHLRSWDCLPFPDRLSTAAPNPCCQSEQPAVSRSVSILFNRPLMSGRGAFFENLSAEANVFRSIVFRFAVLCWYSVHGGERRKDGCLPRGVKTTSAKHMPWCFASSDALRGQLQKLLWSLVCKCTSVLCGAFVSALRLSAAALIIIQNFKKRSYFLFESWSTLFLKSALAWNTFIWFESRSVHFQRFPVLLKSEQFPLKSVYIDVIMVDPVHRMFVEEVHVQVSQNFVEIIDEILVNCSK